MQIRKQPRRVATLAEGMQPAGTGPARHSVGTGLSARAASRTLAMQNLRDAGVELGPDTQMDKEGDVPEAVGMLCQSDLRRRLLGRTSPRRTRREHRVSAPPGGLGRVGSGGHCVTTPEEGALSRGGYGDRYAPFIRAATHAKGIGVTHGTRYRTVGIRGTSHIGECVVVASVWCTDDIVGPPPSESDGQATQR